MASKVLVPTPLTMEEQIQILWSHLAVQLTASNNIIGMPEAIYKDLSPWSRARLLEVYNGAMTLVAIYVRDAQSARVFVGPILFFQRQDVLCVDGQLPLWVIGSVMKQNAIGTNEALSIGATPLPKKVEKIARPPNAFIIYRKFYHSKVVDQNPGMHNNHISTIIGNMWNTESEKVRAEFRQKADMAKREHQRLHPGYTYQPRRPSEKKRRMTKKKASALAAKNTSSTSSFDVARQFGAVAAAPSHLNVGADGRAVFVNLPLTYGSGAQIAGLNNENMASEAMRGAGFGLEPAAASEVFNTADNLIMQGEANMAEVLGNMSQIDATEAWNDFNQALMPMWVPETTYGGDDDFGLFSSLWDNVNRN